KRNDSAKGANWGNRENGRQKSEDQSVARTTGRHAAYLRGHFQGAETSWLQSENKIRRWTAAIRRLAFEIARREVMLPFDQRACFIAGQAKSRTTLLAALLDNHPELLVLPLETAYFPTVLRKYGRSGRRAQFDYLTKESFSRVLFGGEPKWREHVYKDFPQQKFLEKFEHVAFDLANTQRDLLALMAEAYAETTGVPLDRTKRWIEKTPANRNHVNEVFARFPHAKLLVTLRDPRAILATQIALEKTRRTKRFSVYYVIAHWRAAAKLARRVRAGEIRGFVLQFEQLVTEPAN